MYKLIVVDDETIIKKGICNYINWNGMGFNIVSSFEDGKEAIEYLKENNVDVVLTDIRMAEVTGLELAKYIYDHQPQIKVVIFSGYKEFEYARKAVEYGVEHYLLKPIKIEEISKVFKKIKISLDHVKEKKNQLLEQEKYVSEIIPELQEQFWISVLVGSIRSEQAILKKIKALELNIPINMPSAILDIKLDKEDEELNNCDRENQIGRNLIYNIFQEDIQDICFFPVHLSRKEIKIIAVSSIKEKALIFERKLQALITEKCQFVYTVLELELKITLEKVFKNLMELSEYDYMITPNPVSHKEVEQLELSPTDYERLMQKYKLLIGIINDSNFEELDSLMDNIFSKFQELPLLQAQQISIDMFAMLSNKFFKMGIDLVVYMKEKAVYKKIMNTQNINQLKSFSKETLEDAIRLLNDKKNVTSRIFIDQAIDYLKKNYEKDISLEMIADKFFLNSAYFSRLFKQHTGSTFTDYLISLRMEKAVELISTGKYKVYEISRLVGYKGDKYFFRIFKQYTGYSPMEYYRCMVIGGEEDGKKE